MKTSDQTRTIFYLSIAAIITLPIYFFLYLHPAFTNIFFQSIEKEAGIIGSHMSSSLPADEMDLMRYATSDAFQEDLKEMSTIFDIIKIKLFSSSGKIIFSTDDHEIGEVNTKRYFTHEVASGKMISHLVRKNNRTLEDRLVLVDVMETYVPIMHKERFVGAFEIYYNITERKKAFDSLISMSIGIIIAITLLLLSAVIISYSRTKKAEINRSRVEDALMRASKMESLGRLASGIAHEINNPLTNISLSTQILRQTKDEKETSREIASIEANLAKASVIARELLQLARQEESNLIPVNINEIIRSTLILLEHKRKGIIIDQDFSDVPDVAGDPVRLEQVFINILRNSIDAMPEGGNLYISTFYEKGFVTIKICDKGSGIPAANVKKVFEPFFTTKEVGMGTGLGLSICHGIIKQHDGDIEISSKEGEGTTVVIKLPKR